jgi:hypothetical protein
MMTREFVFRKISVSPQAFGSTHYRFKLFTAAILFAMLKLMFAVISLFIFGIVLLGFAFVKFLELMFKNLASVAIHRPAFIPRVILDYTSQQEQDGFKKLERLGKAAMAPEQIWIVQDERQNLNWKLSGQTSINRSKAMFKLFGDTFTERKDFQTSAPMFVLSSQQSDLFVFAPSKIIRYPRLPTVQPIIWEFSDLIVEFKPIRFLETETPPKDSQMLGQTWLYLNKGGGPDRRYKDNRVVPILEYAEIRLCHKLDSLPVAWFHVSNLQCAKAISEALII